MTGKLTVIGLGPGPQCWVTPAASAALEMTTDVFGYAAYVQRLQLRSGQTIHASDNGDEIERANRALALAAAGATVAVVSGGDPGVFAMAAAVFEAIEAGPQAWRELAIQVEPGVTAMLAAAAKVGAPLGHDFCAISLSDNLKPWSTIERRLKLAAEADFVIALYNPASSARPDQIQSAFDILRGIREPTTPVVLARAIGRPDQTISMTTLQSAHDQTVDMRTLVIVGSSATRVIERADGAPWVYTPRFARGAT